MHIPERRNLADTSRNLLLVTFLTLSLTALIFLLAVNSIDRNSRTIFSSVESIIEINTRSFDIYRMLMELELDIRDLINVVLKEPYKLTGARESLRKRFEMIESLAAKGEAGSLQQKLLKQLRWYRSSLERLLWDYGELNSVLYEVYFYINNISQQLSYLEETAGRTLVDYAAEGRNTDSIQQLYVLTSVVREKLLQIQVQVNASVGEFDPVLLAPDEESVAEGKRTSALGRMQVLVNTLRTLPATDEIMSGYSKTILEMAPLLQDNILDLSVKISRLNEHRRLYVVERENTMQLINDLENQNRSRLLSIRSLMERNSRNTMVMAWLISLAVLVIAVVGLLLVRNVGRQLSRSAEEAILAREGAESLNLRLSEEVDARRRLTRDLEQAKEELEQRVMERTVELSSANRGLALEVEERRSVERELASEKERLAVTLRSIGDGVIAVDRNSRVTMLNRAAEKMTGWKMEEAMGKPLQEVFHIICRGTGDVCENPVETLLRTGRIQYLAEETVLLSRDGSSYDISDSCAAIRDMESRVIGAVLVFRDDTERRRMQEEVLKSEKLKSVGVLAGGIAHDFNNILAAILGNISLVKLRIDPQDDPDSHKLLEGAEKASLRARNLTQQLLTFSKGGEPIKKMESIGEIIKDSADFILSGGKVHCDYVIPDGLWPVNIDAGQMSQVVQNVIINSVHAMPGGGKITVTCENFINEEGSGLPLPASEFVRVSFRDEGPGIPKELLDKVFDPYFTTKEEGSGLGLALTHSIISKHQGYIELKSGSWGTDFIIYLPAYPGGEVESHRKKGKAALLPGRARILIMDDEEMVRDIARALLEHLGFEVHTAAEGREAVDLYVSMRESGTPFDAVIMDLTIPGGMGGKEAIRRLREIDPAVKGIVSSGYSNDPVMADYEAHGFSGMVHKPFEIDELLETLREVIGGEGRA
ncbi:MAG: hypothetical protein Kow0089_10390 [Desulfobulbaceae bacterium]